MLLYNKSGMVVFNELAWILPGKNSDVWFVALSRNKHQIPEVMAQEARIAMIKAIANGDMVAQTAANQAGSGGEDE